MPQHLSIKKHKPLKNHPQLAPNIPFKNMLFKSMLLCTALFSATPSFAKTQDITIVTSSNAEQEEDLMQRIVNNINDLLREKHQTNFKVIEGGQGSAYIHKQLLKEENNKQTDIVITTGMNASQQLAQLKNYPKPSIAGEIIDEKLQEISSAHSGRSNIKNFT